MCGEPDLDSMEDDLRGLLIEFFYALGVTDAGAVDAAVTKTMTTAGNRAAQVNGLGTVFHNRIKVGMPVWAAATAEHVPLPRSKPRVALPGDRFGDLTVIEEAPGRASGRFVRVQCACGRRPETVPVRALTSWKKWTKCRVCRRAETGVVFRDGAVFAGRWIVVGNYDPGVRQPVSVRCRECGDEVTVSGERHAHGGPAYCSCRPRPRLTVLAGDRFGRWMVLREAEPGAGGTRRVWCRCDCGREKIVHVHNLRRGVSKGCLQCGIDERERKRREGLL